MIQNAENGNNVYNQSLNGIPCTYMQNAKRINHSRIVDELLFGYKIHSKVSEAKSNVSKQQKVIIAQPFYRQK